jgi:transposase
LRRADAIQIGAAPDTLRMKRPGPAVRTREPCRIQVEMKFGAIDELVGGDHIVRTIDAIVSSLDLRPFHTRWKAVEGRAGKPITSPQMLLTLWIYAVSEGVGSALEIERRTRSDSAFAWIVADLKPSHDVIAAFRVQQGAAFSQLLTDVITALVDKGAISLDVVAQDGTRVRASASAPSFRRKEALLELREQARLHVDAVLSQRDDPEISLAAQAAREAKALDFQRRVEAALSTVAQLQETTDAAENARASTTDADARIMKMADGGFRPAYNVQLAVAGDALGGPRTIVGLQVTNVGSDLGSITPMLDDVHARTGEHPKKLLADANHAKLSCIDAAGARGVEVFVPPMKKRKRKTQDGKPARNKVRVDSPEVAKWRARMTTPDAKALYKQRAALVELGNAHLKDRFGLAQMPVRGLPRVLATTLLYALAMNVVNNAATLLA